MPVHGIETIGFVLDLSVRALAAAGAVALLLRLLRVQAASVRHAAWTVVLAAMLLMPLLPSIVPPLPLPSTDALFLTPRTNVERTESLPLTTPASPTAAPVQSSAPTTATEAAAPRVTAVVTRTSSSATNWIPAIAAGVYVSGLLLFLGRLLYGWRLVRGMVRRSMRADLPGVVYESREVAVPLSAGATRPLIILPTAWKTWPTDTLAAVMAHEMAHVRRRDPLIACLARLNRAIFWFHPLAWWLERQLAITAEHACDEAAAGVVPERRRYAEILIEMADVVRRKQGRVAWQAVGVNGAGLLHERIDRILRGAAPRVSRAQGLATLAASVAAILLVVACQVPPPPLKEDPELAKRLVDQDENIKRFEAARDMPQVQADELEKTIEASPQDFDARQKLVWYYSQSSTVAWDKKVPGLRRHALWLIEHHPEHEVRAPSLAPQYDSEGFTAAKKLWEAHLAKPDASPYLVYRAASFFLPHDKPYAEQLILRGMKMDPDSEALKARMAPNVGGYQWHTQLATLYASALMGSESMWGTYNDLRTHLDKLKTPFAQEVQRKLDASTDASLLARVGAMLSRYHGDVRDRTLKEAQDRVRALGTTYLQKALQIEPNLYIAKYALYRASLREEVGNDADRSLTRAFGAESRGDGREARRLAEEALTLAQTHAGDPAYSASVMKAHHLLATLAVTDGDRDAAIHHLKASAKVPASDEVLYATPISWMEPVKGLLKAGERERVADVLDAFGQLVVTGPEADRFRNDAKAIREGRMPTTYQHAMYRETTPSPFKPMQ